MPTRGEMRRVREDQFEAWLRDELVLAALIACAAFARGRKTARARELVWAFVISAAALLVLWISLRGLAHSLPATAPMDSRDRPPLLTASVAVQALLSLLALIGFGQRF